MRDLLKTLSALLLTGCLGQAEEANPLSNTSPKYDISYKTGDLRISKDLAIQLVNKALKINTEAREYEDINIAVYSKQFGHELYLVANLFRPGEWGYTSYRLDVQDDQVVKLHQDYVEEEPVDPDFCANCPDPEVVAVFAWQVSESPKTVNPAKKQVEAAFTKANLKFKSLIDHDENKNNVLNYLSCPKLTLYGRIGHGSNGSIMLGGKGGANLTARDISSEPFKNAVKGKYFPFNSCYVAGNSATFGKTLVQSGANWMCGGDGVPLGMGSSEPVWTKFIVEVSGNGEVAATYSKHMTNAKDRWRAQSSGAGPYYPFKTSWTPFE